MKAFLLSVSSGALVSVALGVVSILNGCGTASRFNIGDDIARADRSNAEASASSQEEEGGELGFSATGARCKIDFPSGCGGVPKATVYETTSTVINKWFPLLQFGSTLSGEACRLRARQYANECVRIVSKVNPPAIEIATATYISSSGTALLSKKIGTTGKRAVFSINGYCRSLALATFNQVAVPSSGVVSISNLEDIWGEAKGDPEHLDAHASTRFNEIVSECRATPNSTHIEYLRIENDTIVKRFSNR